MSSYETYLTIFSMNDLAQLRDYSQQIAAAVGSLIDSRSEADSSGQLPDNLEDENERNKAKEDILASVASIKSLLIGPTGFLQHLASQVCRLLFLSAALCGPTVWPFKFCSLQYGNHVSPSSLRNVMSTTGRDPRVPAVVG